MASWSELLESCEQNEHKPKWLLEQLTSHLNSIAEKRESCVIFYASSFLQNPTSRAYDVSISQEDVNGLMNALYGVPTGSSLTLLLHTPGGDPNAVESIVEYLHAKFSSMETVIPYLAMSGGTMISLASNQLVLGHQSQIGPIDPQIVIDGKPHSARAIKEGFDKAREDIMDDIKLAHLWAPILQNMGPSLLLEAEKALSYSKELVMKWLANRMFKAHNDEAKRKCIVNTIASYFNAESTRKYGQIHVHGQRIGPAKLQELGISIEPLEQDQNLQNDVLTAYHLMTLLFETTPALKFIASNQGKLWIKQRSQILVQQSQNPNPANNH